MLRFAAPRRRVGGRGRRRHEVPLRARQWRAVRARGGPATERRPRRRGWGHRRGRRRRQCRDEGGGGETAAPEGQRQSLSGVLRLVGFRAGHAPTDCQGAARRPLGLRRGPVPWPMSFSPGRTAAAHSGEARREARPHAGPAAEHRVVADGAQAPSGRSLRVGLGGDARERSRPGGNSGRTSGGSDRSAPGAAEGGAGAAEGGVAAAER
mmetsp:Transcript_18473/g.53428  ORF Transcript_18473/g.53428 Transcript_18473/m.53428 type:complete len:209 (+) Transcript_18473:612-1238(+)